MYETSVALEYLYSLAGQHGLALQETVLVKVFGFGHCYSINYLLWSRLRLLGTLLGMLAMVFM